MAESQSMTTAEVVAKALIDEHADFLREAVAMVAARADGGRDRAPRSAPRRGEVSPSALDAPQRLPAAGPGRPGSGRSSWRSRASARARPTSPRFLEPRRRGEQAIVCGRHGGLRQRRLDPQGRPPGRRARDLGMTKDRVSRICRGSTSGSRPSAAARWRAPTPTSGSTPSTSRSATAATCAPRRWWSPTRCTRPGAAR